MDMVDTEQEVRDYELSFLAFNEVAAQSVAAVLAQHSVAVLVSMPARQMTLAYPIKKHQTALFGYFQFATLPETIKTIHDALFFNKEILRFLIVTPPIKKAIERPRGLVYKESPPQLRTENPNPIEAPVAKRGEALTNEALEQKLEEILQ